MKNLLIKIDDRLGEILGDMGLISRFKIEVEYFIKAYKFIPLLKDFLISDTFLKSDIKK